MFRKLLFAAFLIFNSRLFAQDSTSYRPPDPQPNTPPSSDPVWQPPESRPKAVHLSANPTAQEFTDLFVGAARGEFDPFEVIGKIVEKKGDVVSALSEVLFSETITQTPPLSTVLGADSMGGSPQLPRPNKVYAVWCLRAIGTAEAYSALTQAAASHKEINVRALSMQCLALDYLQKVRGEGTTPDKEIVHLFLRNADDTTASEEIRKTIGELAREGLKNWAGIDLGSGTKTIAERELWWLENQDRLFWNNEKGLFEIR